LVSTTAIGARSMSFYYTQIAQERQEQWQFSMAHQSPGLGRWGTIKAFPGPVGS
jgi:hypothetical protein